MDKTMLTRGRIAALMADHDLNDDARMALLRLWLLGDGAHQLRGGAFADVFGHHRGNRERAMGLLVRCGYMVWAQESGGVDSQCAVEAVWPPMPNPRGRAPNGRIIPDGTRHRVFDRDGARCVRCGGTERLALDHIVRFEDGGPNTPENLRVLCTPCNLEREHRHRRRAARTTTRLFFTRR